MKDPYGIKIAVKLPEQFRADLEVRAAADGTTVSTVVRRLLSLWLAGEVVVVGVPDPLVPRPSGGASPNYPGNS